MTQAVIAVPPALATATAPVAANLAEPTMEELAALVPLPEAEPLVEYAQPGTEPAAEPTEPVKEPEVAAAPDTPAEVDEALERAQAAAKRAREGSKRYKETQRQLAEQSQRAEQAARDAAAFRQESEAARAREAEYLKDPYGTLKKRGMTDVQLAERAMKENTPEALTESRLAQAEAKAAAAEAKATALEKRIEADRVAAERDATISRAEAGFFETAKAEAETYPELAKAKPATQLWAAKQALEKIHERGYATNHFTNPMIVEAAAKWFAKHLEELGVKPGEATAPATKPGLAKTKPSGETLTNKQAQTRTVAPAAWDSLTDEQQIAHIAAGLPEPSG